MTNSISARHKYPSFDLLKLLLAYFVVAIHSNMNNYSGWIGHVIYTAVPIFFSISGFLMYPRYQDVSYIKNYCLKIFKLYFLWTILYLPLTIYGIKINNLHGFSIIESLIRGTFVFEFQQICQMSEFSVFAISTTLATVLSYSLIKVSQQQRFAFLNKLIIG